MSFVVTLTAALKAIPEIVGAVRDISDGIKKMNDARDDSQFEEFKKEIDKVTKEIRLAESKEEMLVLVERLNTL